MHEVNIQEAERSLFKLIEEVEFGEEVIIKKENGTYYKIVPIIKNEPIPKFGSAKGLIEISDDFDEPLEEFKEYMP
ncbi:MAG: type II toxin-antitoxin system Phd/YefM family antitoxin [Candidatus Anammoxibacter sp.]